MGRSGRILQVTDPSLLAGLHHVQLAIPPGGEDACRRFWGALLGMAEVDNPPALTRRP